MQKARLWHHWRWNGMPAGPWPGKRIITGVSAGLPDGERLHREQHTEFRGAGAEGRRTLAPLALGRYDGRSLARRPGRNPVTGSGCFLQGDFRSGAHANFELIGTAQIQDPGAAPISRSYITSGCRSPRVGLGSVARQ